MYHAILDVMSKNLMRSLMINDIKKCDNTYSYISILAQQKYLGREKKYFMQSPKNQR